MQAEDLSSIPDTYIKADVVAHTYNSCARKVQTGESRSSMASQPGLIGKPGQCETFKGGG